MIRVYIGIALCLALAGGGWWLHHSGYESGMAACRAAQREASGQAMQDHMQAAAVADRVQTHITSIGAIKVADSIEASHDTVKTIVRTVAAAPSPADCVAPAGSVHALRKAVHRANAAGNPLREPLPGKAPAGHP